MEHLLRNKKIDILDTMGSLNIGSSDLALLDDLMEELITIAVENPIETPCAEINVASVDIIGKMLAEQVAPIVAALTIKKAKKRVAVAKKVVRRRRPITKKGRGR